jgi:methylmalonyl-CoA epimerase
MFGGIHHVAVAVRNLEEALAFYHGKLGLALGKQATVPDQGVKAALLPLGEDEIELLEPTNPAGGVARFLEKKGEGVHHFCVETSDVAAAIERAKTLGLQLIDQAPRQGLAGAIGFLHPSATQGVLVELAQPAEEGPHPHAPATGIRAVGMSTLYLATKDPAASAEALSRNYEAKATGLASDPRFGARTCVVEIGSSRVTLIDAAEFAASPVGGRILAGRGEGLCGLCIAVEDLDDALRHLGQNGIPTEKLGDASVGFLAWIPAERAHGVNLFLSAAARRA